MLHSYEIIPLNEQFAVLKFPINCSNTEYPYDEPQKTIIGYPETKISK